MAFLRRKDKKPPKNVYEESVWEKVQYVAVYEYTAQRSGDLSFAEGDELSVVEEGDGGWWKAVNKRTGEAGYVPSNFIHKKQGSIVPTKKVVLGVYLALHDFSDGGDGTLAFKKHDRLEVLDKTDAGWWRARVAGQDGTEGMVPVNFIVQVEDLNTQRWYWGRSGRAEVQDALVTMTLGCFVVRDSETADGYSLSVLGDGGQVRHYRIRQSEGGHYFVRSKESFRCIKDLVEFFKQTHEPPGPLTNACVKPVALSSTPVLDKKKGGGGGEEEEKGGGKGEGGGEQKEKGSGGESAGGEGTLTGVGDGGGNTWEIERKSLEFGSTLGSGHFGEVKSGKWNKRTKVAIKSMREGTMDKHEFLKEAEVMMLLKHPRLVKLYGVCTKPDTEAILIVTELMERGSLLEHLQKRKDDHDLHTPSELTGMCRDVASGMAYLEQEQFVHRDLAARNVLVAQDLTVKVADFGLTRVMKEEVYQQGSSIAIPVKWTAPEAMQIGLYTTKSDVWAFGILMYEIFTHGGKPYPGKNNEQTKQFVADGKRMDRPDHCPSDVYKEMAKCWLKNPDKRPTFAHLKKKLNK